jgi:protein-S-isoprenylcysteine O-methyltransferase Ste14
VSHLNRSPRFQYFIFEPQHKLAYLVFGGSLLLGLWAMLTVAIVGQGTPMPFDAPRKLVTTGPYAWMRNPLLMAGIGQGMAATLYTGALLILPCVVAGIVFCQIVVWHLEKPELERAFGRNFEAYRRSVRYWLPMRRRWMPERRDGRPISLDEIVISPRRKRAPE